eukprot:3518214-Amphidinium_carterae.1
MSNGTTCPGPLDAHTFETLLASSGTARSAGQNTCQQRAPNLLKPFPRTCLCTHILDGCHLGCHSWHKERVPRMQGSNYRLNAMRRISVGRNLKSRNFLVKLFRAILRIQTNQKVCFCASLGHISVGLPFMWNGPDLD